MKKRLVVLGFIISNVTYFYKAQEKKDSIIADELYVNQIEIVTIENEKPITAKTLNREEINLKNVGQDLPILLKNTPSVITTSDAGAGIGYTGLRIRGSDATRINVTVNGIPLNDSESQGVFWVNLPDFTSSTNSIVIQRGLGTSTNGTGAFGGSVNVGTLKNKKERYGVLNTTYGSFDSKKINLKLGTGNIGKFNIEGRLSYIKSDGYIDRSRSKLSGYSLKASYNNQLKFLAFGGHEETYQAWNGIDKATLDNNRTYNTSGEIYDNSGKLTGFYENEIDDYRQNHYQLHYNFKVLGWKSHTALHYTFGKGFYENYKNDEKFSDYSLNSLETGDLVRQKWLKNYFFGWVFDTKKRVGDLEWTIGASANRYDGSHFGKVISTPERLDIKLGEKYYQNQSYKEEVSAYVKAEWNDILENIDIFGDIQVRDINYKGYTNLETSIDDNPDFSNHITFINPKIGIDWNLGHSKIYGYYGLGHKEPNRNDYVSDSNIQPEKLQNIELGYRNSNSKLNYNVNGYLMYYNDQLVLTGSVNDETGAPLRENSGKSYRLGLELEVNYMLYPKWQIGANATFSRNRNKDYFITDFDGNPLNIGNTNISYSPEVITNGFIEYKPLKNLLLNLTGKYVGEQFLSNESIPESKLDAYFVTDLLLKYQIPLDKKYPQVGLTLLINNLFDYEYENNGYYYNYYISENEISHNSFYFPQAGINFLAGLNIKF